MQIEITSANIDMLNNLPSTLKDLKCSGLKLTNLPELPPTLEILNCKDNFIKSSRTTINIKTFNL